MITFISGTLVMDTMPRGGTLMDGGASLVFGFTDATSNRGTGCSERCCAALPAVSMQRTATVGIIRRMWTLNSLTSCKMRQAYVSMTFGPT